MAQRKASNKKARATENDILNEAFARIKSLEAQVAENEAAGAETETDPHDETAQVTETQAELLTGARKPKAPKPPKLVSSNEPQRVAGGGKKSAEITYHPGPDDKSWTIWYGIKFEANLPKTVHNQEVIELAKGNPWFSVDGKRAPKQKKPIPQDEELSLEARAGLPDGFEEIEAS